MDNTEKILEDDKEIENTELQEIDDNPEQEETIEDKPEQVEIEEQTTKHNKNIYNTLKKK
eukprot:12881310-Prorocentrum_lima.AAC.1